MTIFSYQVKIKWESHCTQYHHPNVCGCHWGSYDVQLWQITCIMYTMGHALLNQTQPYSRGCDVICVCVCVCVNLSFQWNEILFLQIHSILLLLYLITKRPKGSIIPLVKTSRMPTTTELITAILSQSIRLNPMSVFSKAAEASIVSLLVNR